MPAAANVTLDQEAYLVSEFDLFEMVCAELVEGELQRDITVYLSTSDGTAFGKLVVHTTP